MLKGCELQHDKYLQDLVEKFGLGSKDKVNTAVFYGTRTFSNL